MQSRIETDEVRSRVNGSPSLDGGALDGSAREGEAPAEQAPAHAGSADTGPPAFARHLADVGTHLARLARVRVDRAEHHLRRKVALGIAAVLALLVTSVVSTYGAVLLARGLAGTLGALAGDRPWLGELGAGVLLLGGTVAIGALLWRAFERRELAKKLQEYGHDHA